MADHKREQILDATITTLNALVTTAVDQVVRGRDTPYPLTVDKALSVYAGNDEPIENSGWDAIYSNLVIYVDIHVRTSSEQIDTLINEVRKQVTIALFTDFTQGLSFVNDLTEESALEPELEGSGEAVTGLMRVNFKYLYNRSYSDPSL